MLGSESGVIAAVFDFFGFGGTLPCSVVVIDFRFDMKFLNSESKMRSNSTDEQVTGDKVLMCRRDWIKNNLYASSAACA
jgi:hypothetical protein